MPTTLGEKTQRVRALIFAGLSLHLETNVRLYLLDRTIALPALPLHCMQPSPRVRPDRGRPPAQQRQHVRLDVRPVRRSGARPRAGGGAHRLQRRAPPELLGHRLRECQRGRQPR